MKVRPWPLRTYRNDLLLRHNVMQIVPNRFRYIHRDSENKSGTNVVATWCTFRLEIATLRYVYSARYVSK